LTLGEEADDVIGLGVEVTGRGAASVRVGGLGFCGVDMIGRGALRELAAERGATDLPPLELLPSDMKAAIPLGKGLGRFPGSVGVGRVEAAAPSERFCFSEAELPFAAGRESPLTSVRLAVDDARAAFRPVSERPCLLEPDPGRDRLPLASSLPESWLELRTSGARPVRSPRGEFAPFRSDADEPPAPASDRRGPPR